MGRPPKNIEIQREVKKQTRQDETDRIPIEEKFDQGKRRFSLSKIMCKLDRMSGSAIAVAFFVTFYTWQGPIWSIWLLCGALSAEIDSMCFVPAGNHLTELLKKYRSFCIVQEVVHNRSPRITPVQRRIVVKF